MEDIIDIIVTETTNTIEITSQATDEIIDVNIIDNREDITLNVTPSLVEININSLTGNFGVEWGDITGTLVDQTDLNTALGLKADLVGGKVPSSQLPSYVDDVVEVANYAALPATGETGKIYVTLDTNKIYRWSGSAYIEIADSTAVWGAITGTLSSQTDLQNALNAKFDDPTGDTTQYIAGDGSLITFPIAGQAGTLVREVRNTTGATLTKGTIVYISGATGNKPTVSKAIATGDSTSAQTFGMCQSNISNNSNGYVVCVGDITGLDTSAVSEGVQLYLSSTTAGEYTTTKQYAPAHLVYIGVVTRSHPTLGQIEVKIQNGYELDEIHDVAISSKANNDGLFYESSTSLWKNKSIATVLGYSPEQPLTFSSPLSRSTNAVSIPVATTSVNGYLTSTDWTTFNAKQAALSGSGIVKSTGGTISYLTDNTTNWDTAYNDKINSASVSGTTTKTLTLTQQDGGTVTASWTDINTDAVSSVFGRTGAVVATSGDYTTAQVTEVTNLYYTDARARASVSGGTGISYNSTTGVITNTITQYTDALARAALSFTAGSGAYNSTTGVITIPTNTNQLTNGASFITLGSLSAGTGISYNNTTGVITNTITQYTDALARAAISLTVSGSSGASTYNSTTGVLNVPTYTLSGLGGQPALSGTGFVKISGTTISYDNSTYALDSAVVKLTGSQTIAGTKKFTDSPLIDIDLGFKTTSGVYTYLGAFNAGWSLGMTSGINHLFYFGSTTARSYTFPNADGTVALTSNLSSYLPLSGGTLTGALSGTSASFSSTITAQSTGGSGLRVYGGNGTNQWDVYLNSTNLRFSDNTGTGSVVFDRPLSGTSATFSSSVQATSIGVNTSPSYPLHILRATGSDYIAKFEHTSAAVVTQGVLINTPNDTSDTSFLLNVQSASTSRFVVKGNGNVGIGTTSPNSFLDIQGASAKASGASTGYWHSAIIDTTSAAAGVGGGLQFMGYKTGTAALGFFGAIAGVKENSTSGNEQGALVLYTSTSAAAGITEKMRITSGGDLGINITNPSAKLQVNLGNGTAGNNVAIFGDSAGATYSLGVVIQNVNTISYNATNTGIKVGSNTSSGRSINASGTVNAMGLDYAEYMTKSTSENINKGDIVGIDSNGLLTDLFELSISFGIKSTNPSFVGGDGWGVDKEDVNLLEQERQKVDRIAFSGQVPCNVLNAKVGDYIIPINDNGKIKGQSVTNPTFEQYQISVGKVWKIMQDGRAWVAIKIG